MSDQIHDHNDEPTIEDSDDTAPSGSRTAQERKCPWCPKIFPEGLSLKKHLGRIHASHSIIQDSRKKEGSGRLLCAKRGCGQMLVSYDALCRHCADEHDFVLNYESLRFDNSDHFKSWLTHLTSISGDMVKRRGERRTSDGITMGDFHCVFDGKKRETPSTRAPDRNPYNRRVPSKKLGFACPAFIRFQILNDGSVTVRAQLQHFGHDLKPRDPGHTISKVARHGLNLMGRRKEKRRGYAFDGLNYDEVHPQHMNPSISNDDEQIEVDEQGMVNLFSCSSLEQARFYAQSSFASLEIAFAEVQSIPQENVLHVGHLIEKLHEIADAASRIERMVKELETIPADSSRINDSAKRKMHKIPRLHEKIVVKEGVDDEKRGLRRENGSNEEECFDRQSDCGEVEYEGEVAEEIIVDDDDDYVHDKEERDEQVKKED